ncbi:MAG: hypothetical protein ISN29_11500, partial [Gammaproteobacteria bacterium AqS3]|nr:hypothetical protein [Gammaproteobacteria bacterium AqS3]
IVNLSGVLGLDALDGDIAELLRCIRSAGALTCLDMIYNTAADAPAIVHSALEHVDCFAPSLEEAQLVAGTEALSAADMARMFCDRGCGVAVVKQGAEGCFLCSGGGEVLHIPACTPGQVLDATGAGDAWVGGFLTGLLRGEDAVRSAQLGNAAASFCIEAPGTTAGIPALDQVLARRAAAPEPRPAA